ncbi:hypothetical protein KUCAC02_001132, partial [Chaenocephalus aceratus]
GHPEMFLCSNRPPLVKASGVQTLISCSTKDAPSWDFGLDSTFEALRFLHFVTRKHRKLTPTTTGK